MVAAEQKEAAQPEPAKVVVDADEYERVPVDSAAFQSNSRFASVFAGRHTAAPELVIGPQFVRGGATMPSMFIGLLIGNILAVLSWRFVCAPVAVANRFTTYHQVERICGKPVLFVYNIIVGLTLAVIAGGMFTIAGTALGAGLSMEAPTASDFFMPHWGQVVLVVGTGLLTTVVATFGYGFVSAASSWLTPPMFMVFIYMVFRSFAILGVHSFEQFFEVASNKVFTGELIAGRKLDFMSVVLMAWFQDQFCHLGMVDLTLLRFGRSARVGWLSAYGVFPGHYFLWIGAGFLYCAHVADGGDPDIIMPGPMGYSLAGWPGLLAILFAGWSTANPFLYASGLAFKSALQATGRISAKASHVTCTVGLIASVAGLFPVVIYQFLDFLGIAGAAILPMGAIIFADCWVLPRIGIDSDYSAVRGSDCSAVNVAAVVAWSSAAAVAVPLVACDVVAYFYVPFIGFPLGLVVYVALSKVDRLRKAPSGASESPGESIEALP